MVDLDVLRLAEDLVLIFFMKWYPFLKTKFKYPSTTIWTCGLETFIVVLQAISPVSVSQAELVVTNVGVEELPIVKQCMKPIGSGPPL